MSTQLDKAHREHLETVVKDLRSRAEQTIQYQIDTHLNLEKDTDTVPDRLEESERRLREQVRTAIRREQAGDQRTWATARDLYVKAVGYTLVNRLAALRCMEVRGFLDRSPTRFREDGLTPAADRLVMEQFMTPEEGVWTGFVQTCQNRAEEVDLLFDLHDPYSLLYGDMSGWTGTSDPSWSTRLRADLVELLRDLCAKLDTVEDAVWRADDVLGWVYEYYNIPDLAKVEDKRSLNPEDVTVANQFYTPHWVVRMLTDNSLGKLFLEHEGTLQETIQEQAERFSPEDRKTRDPEAANSLTELCTYLVPTEEEGEATDFDHPSEIRVFDPACGSGHFLLYAFDVLERIWWTMEPGIDRADVPAKILQHNLFGVDLDLRACQLAAFNLYLKARTRAEEHGVTSFEMPQVGIVCADAHNIDTDLAHSVFDEVAGTNNATRDLLDETVETFVTTSGLGSLFDPKAPFRKAFEERGAELSAVHGSDLTALFRDIRKAVQQHTDNGGFAAADLRSLARLLVLLSQDYDVTLMNPPYGSAGRMPAEVKNYVSQKYTYSPEYYINFFEIGKRLGKKHSRVSMLVPRSFMFNRSFEQFRVDFVSGKGSFDFLAEFGREILDNATVRTVGTVIRVGAATEQRKGRFVRLSDVDGDKKEKAFIGAVFDNPRDGDINRLYEREISEFQLVPSTPLSYWAPKSIRKLFHESVVLDANQAGLPGRGSGAEVVTGVKTGKISRFLRKFWEVPSSTRNWMPFPKGGEETWMLPRIDLCVNWNGNGSEIERQPAATQGTKGNYFREGITYNIEKSNGRRFGIMPKCSVFSAKGVAIFTDAPRAPVVGYLNSRLVTYLVFCLTPERTWQIGTVAKLPWKKELMQSEEVLNLCRQILSGLATLRQSSFLSPHYRGPLMLRMIGETEPSKAYRWHPHRNTVEFPDTVDLPSVSPEISLEGLGIQAETFRSSVRRGISRAELRLNEIIFAHFDIRSDQRSEVLTEIALRTNEDPQRLTEYNPELITEPPEDFPELVKKMLLHLIFEILEEDDDGIVLLGTESDGEETDLLAQMIDKFESIWGEYAADRLQEVDDILGSREATDDAYPNLRHWLQHKLFAFHCSQFENTPILWQLSTDRLDGGNTDAVGFACLVDYHQMDGSLFDRLSTRYLDARKTALREREAAARRTMEDNGADAATQREATAEAKRCAAGLRQIEELETRMTNLSRTKPRSWAADVKDIAKETAPKVRRFRERLEDRLDTLDRLHEISPSAWFKDRFSDKFMEKVNGEREEWIDALEDLEAACKQFAQPANEPVEAHLYDLLPYFNDKLTGSTHYASYGIFFLNYYFKKGSDLAERLAAGDGDKLTEQQRLVAELATHTDDDIALGEEIKSACKRMQKPMDADWKARALEEVETAGYTPVKKHGVAINITPLAEKKLVPSLVEDKVL